MLTSEMTRIHVRFWGKFKVNGNIPSALLVLYKIHTGKEAEDLLRHTDGRNELRKFIAQHLLPMLQTPADPNGAYSDDEKQSTGLNKAFGLVTRLLRWLDDRLGTPWGREQMSPNALMYLLQDDPRIMIWRGNTTEMTLMPTHGDNETLLTLAEIET